MIHLLVFYGAWPEFTFSNEGGSIPSNVENVDEYVDDAEHVEVFLIKPTKPAGDGGGL